MKKLAFTASFILVALLSTMALPPEGNSNAEEGIRFQSGNWNEALNQARKENKLIFLDIYASWCGPCKKLKAKTFPDESVGAFYNANFINFAIDAEKGEGINLASRYGVRAYPTLLFVDGNGKVIAKTMGYHNPDEFLDIGHQILKIK